MKRTTNPITTKELTLGLNTMNDMTRIITLALALAFPAALSAQTTARLSLDWQSLSDMVTRQMALEPGERVLLVAHPDMFQDLIGPLRRAVAVAGGIDLGVIDVLAGPAPPAPTMDASRAALRQMFRAVDIAVMLPGATTAHAPYLAIQDLLREGHGRAIHFHWFDDGSISPVLGQPVPPFVVVDAVYQRAVLETDYAALAARQVGFADAMRDAEIRVTTRAGTDLRFRIGDRPVNMQNGDASAARAVRGTILVDREIELPAGAIRVAPIEESVHGTIVFLVSQWSLRPVQNLRLRIENGRVVDVEAESGREFVEREMNQAGDAGRAFREFGLGFNPLLAIPADRPWIPYYGYGAGVVRLSLGDNSELGGRVTGGYVRWNFFTDATVRVGDVVWVQDGTLVVP